MYNIPISQHKPEKVLLNCDAVTNIVNEYIEWYEPQKERRKYKELVVTLLVDIALNLISLLSAIGAMKTFAICIAGGILVLLIIYTIVCITKWYEAYKKVRNRKAVNLNDMLIERSKDSIKYTGIIRIAYKNNGTLLYLTGEDYFLPHCNMDKSLSINEQRDQILQSLQEDFGINERNVLKVVPVDEEIHYSIKPIHGSVQMNAFAFYDVTLKEQIKGKLVGTRGSNRRWVSIEDMKKNPDAMATNKDVVGMLESFPRPKESFENILGDIKIIWNITAKCPYKCAICATHDGKRKELNLSEKYKVLNEIGLAKELIKSLDFAGGDPLQFKESSMLIKSAIQQLGADKVSITTTGKGLSKLNDEEFANVVKRFEITIDAAHATLQQGDGKFVSRNEDNYLTDNIDNVVLISGYAEALTINIPIINDDLSDEEIDNLVKKVVHIRNSMSGIEVDTSLIRLMPVGKMSTTIEKQAYEKYNPIPVAKRIKLALEKENIPCKLHCSLRVLPCFAEDSHGEIQYCNMLENKLGIDCAGNVFACAWGAYLQTSGSIDKNPFYLGNLTKKPLIDILTGKVKTKNYTQIFNEIENRKERNFCSVISYYEAKQMFANNDPLSKIVNK